MSAQPRAARDRAGCRPDQLFGLWAIEELRLRRYVEMAKEADLNELRAESRALAAESADEPLYRVDGDGLAVIDISGPMTKHPHSFQALFGGTSTVRVRSALRTAARDPDVLGIMLRIDSPGGTVGGMAELAKEIRSVAARKPLHSYGDDLAASAGMLALTQARKAWASPNAEVGSLGVYMVVDDTSKRYEQAGVKVHVVSSAPPLKGAGVDGSEVTPPQLAEWGRRVEDLAEWFVAEVSRGRGRSTEEVRKLATGQVWIAEKAQEAGLIDGVLSFDEAMDRLRSEVMEEQDTKVALDMAAESEKKAAEERTAREEAEKKLAEAQGKLTALEGEKRRAKFAEDATRVGAPAAFAQTLDAIEKGAGSEAYGNLMIQLAALKEQVDAGDLFKEKGTGGDASEKDPEATLKAMAEDIVAKGEAKDFHAGYELACERRPDLVAAARPGRKEA